MKRLIHFIRDESGATAIEYTLIASLMAVAIITAIQTSGGQISAAFTRAALN